MISTILLIVAYIRLKLQGVCAWDLDVGSRVVHARVGALRTIAAVFVIVVGVPFLVLLVPIVVAMVSS